MPLIWCSISAHGYGHAAQAVPGLNALGRRLGDLRIIVRTQVPRTYFDGRLVGRWEHSDEQQDVGCIQHGPLDIDEPATWRAHDAFEAAWAARLHTECRLLEHHHPDLVISAISYLSVAAAARIGIKAVAVGSLSWDTVLGFFESSKEARHRELITSISGRSRSRCRRSGTRCERRLAPWVMNGSSSWGSAAFRSTDCRLPPWTPCQAIDLLWGAG